MEGLSRSVDAMVWIPSVWKFVFILESEKQAHGSADTRIQCLCLRLVLNLSFVSLFASFIPSFEVVACEVSPSFRIDFVVDESSVESLSESYAVVAPAICRILGKLERF